VLLAMVLLAMVLLAMALLGILPGAVGGGLVVCKEELDDAD
jgi:hypothetical protein